MINGSDSKKILKVELEWCLIYKALMPPEALAFLDHVVIDIR